MRKKGMISLLVLVVLGLSLMTLGCSRYQASSSSVNSIENQDTVVHSQGEMKMSGKKHSYWHEWPYENAATE